MPRRMNMLTARAVDTIRDAGRHADGGNLYLVVTRSGTKNWSFFFDFQGKRREMGLGPVRDVSLAEARGKAAEARKLLIAGVNPITARRAKQEIPSFGAFADSYVETMRPQWKSAKHADQWAMTLKEYAKPIRARAVDAIGVDDVLKVLKPIWTRTPETGERLRGRIENVLDAARAKGFRTGDNPARWRGHLDQLLPKRQRLKRGHHAALPYGDIPAFMVELRSREALAALVLEFTVLTACRSGEVLLACWNEIDTKAAVWTVPAERMKAGREHRVPLSARALAILDEVKPLASGDDPFVFPGKGKGKPLSNMGMGMLMRRMGRENVTVHGFRSSFRDWASETTGFPHEVCEMALAHTIGNKAEAAYRRGDLFEKRRDLMAAWAAYCEPKAANVVPLKHKRM